MTTKKLSRDVLQLTKEGQEVVEKGSPEARVFALVPAEGGIMQEDLEKAAGAALAKVGQQKAVQQKWLTVKKEELPEAAAAVPEGGKKPKAPSRILRSVASIDDAVKAQLQKVVDAKGAVDCLEKAVFEELKKRKLVQKATFKSVSISKLLSSRPSKR